ncbi:CHAT domain-containing protein [Mycena galopus ATCC 62051]|nr:CHAT domain-containing protein [Mycena galopus ATCC 62051]
MHSGKADCLTNLAMALEKRFTLIQSLTDLQEAIPVARRAVEIISNDIQKHPTTVHVFSSVLASMVDHSGTVDAAEELLALSHRILSIFPLPHPLQLVGHTNVARALQFRYSVKKDVTDLDEAVVAMRRVIQLPIANPSDVVDLLNNLGASLHTRFIDLGKREDLDESISALRRAVKAADNTNPHMPTLLRSLRTALHTRFERFDAVQDLEEEISNLRQLTLLTGNDDEVLNDLGFGLRQLFLRRNCINDLDEAISVLICASEASQASAQTVHEALCFNNLGITFVTRFEHFGDVEDCKKAITALRHAISASPYDEPNYLSNLCGALYNHFVRYGDRQVIDEAICMARRAVEISSYPGSDAVPAQVPLHHMNLGNALWALFERHGDIPTIDEAITCFRRAIQLGSDAHPDRALHLLNLGDALRSRYQALGNSSDIEESIQTLRHTIRILPDDSQQNLRALCLSNLSVAFQNRFDRLKDPGDTEEAVAAIQRCVDLTDEKHPDKPRHLNNLGNSLRLHFLSHYRVDRGLDIETAAKAIAATRRAVELTDDNHPKKPVFLLSLSACIIGGDLFNLDLGASDEAITVVRQGLKLLPDGHPDKPGFYMNLACAFRRRLSLTRDCADFQDAFQYYILASSPQTLGRTSERFLAAKDCTMLCAEYPQLSSPDNLLEAHKSIMNVIPEIVWLGHDVKRRYKEVSQIGGIIRAAVAAAITSANIEQALEWLEEGNAIIWAQILQLRTSLDKLELQHPELAGKLASVASLLERAGNFTAFVLTNTKNIQRDSLEEAATYHRQLASSYNALLGEVRRLNGFEDFLLPRKIKALAPAAATGPVVAINLHESRCDALILFPDAVVVHVPLPNLDLNLATKMSSQLVSALREFGLRGRGASQDYNHGGDDDVRPVLGKLWTTVVNPVLSSSSVNARLYDATTEKIPHITWCATGALAFLPLHAAGDYRSAAGYTNVSDFVVSSYTPTLATLLPDPLSSKLSTSERAGRRVLIVSQPNAPGHPQLLGVAGEVKTMRTKHFPGSTILADAEAKVEDVVKAMTQHTWVHLACHGIQDLNEPLKSAFILNDGPLEISELMRHSMHNAELAVLSACQTATGDAKLPDEAVHLAACMLAMGFKSVVGTMWSIGDSDAPLVADAFYSSLTTMLKEGEKITGSQVAYALHEAVNSLRQGVARHDFLRWVPFVHFGI